MISDAFGSNEVLPDVSQYCVQRYLSTNADTCNVPLSTIKIR
jgi:hypothetical protein